MSSEQVFHTRTEAEVAADLEVTPGHGLSQEEAALTGESLPVTKHVSMIDNPAIPLGDRLNMAYKGTQVTRGHAMVFTVLTFCQLANVLVIRSERETLFGAGFLANLPLLGTVILTIGLHLMVIYNPFFNLIFHTTPLTMEELVVCFTLPSFVVLAVEIEKWLVKRGWIYNSNGQTILSSDT